MPRSAAEGRPAELSRAEPSPVRTAGSPASTSSRLFAGRAGREQRALAGRSARHTAVHQTNHRVGASQSAESSRIAHRRAGSPAGQLPPPPSVSDPTLCRSPPPPHVPSAPIVTLPSSADSPLNPLSASALLLTPRSGTLAGLR